MLVKRFRGRVVKRMRRVPGGILLTFLSNTAGDLGEQMLVSQAQWQREGSELYEPNVTLAELRRRQAASETPTNDSSLRSSDDECEDS